MEKFTYQQQRYHNSSFQQAGRPTIPSGRQPVVERKMADPSSALPRGGSYPLPLLTESRLRNVEQ